MKKRAIYVAFASVAVISLTAEEVGITKDIPSVTIEANGKSYTIEREKRPDAYLTNTFALTSRPSPPFLYSRSKYPIR